MSNESIIARPYAKAVFDHALANAGLTEWSERLSSMTAVVLDPDAHRFLMNPAASVAQKKELMLAVFKESADVTELERWVEVLVTQGRLLVIPEIYRQFLALREDYQQTMSVLVKTFSALSSTQEKALSRQLMQRFGRQVELKIEVDESLLGGLVIQAGDLVIDGSIRTKLQEMHAHLVA